MHTQINKRIFFVNFSSKQLGNGIFTMSNSALGEERSVRQHLLLDCYLIHLAKIKTHKKTKAWLWPQRINMNS